MLAPRTHGSRHGALLPTPVAPSPFGCGCGCPRAVTASRARPRELSELQPPPAADVPAPEPLLGLRPAPSPAPRPRQRLVPAVSAEQSGQERCGQQRRAEAVALWSRFPGQPGVCACPSHPGGKCCPGARARHVPFSLTRAINPPPGREGCTRCCQSRGGRWVQGTACPCQDGPAVPQDPGMTQSGRAGAGWAISATANPEVVSGQAVTAGGCKGTSHGRADPTGPVGLRPHQEGEDAKPRGQWALVLQAAGREQSQRPARGRSGQHGPCQGTASVAQSRRAGESRGHPRSSSPAQAQPHGCLVPVGGEDLLQQKPGKWHFVRGGISTGNLCFQPRGYGWEQPQQTLGLSSPQAFPPEQRLFVPSHHSSSSEKTSWFLPTEKHGAITASLGL